MRLLVSYTASSTSSAKAPLTIASIASNASQRSGTQAALANMPLHTALLTAALASAETPKYCGRAGSGVDELRAPDSPATLRSVQVVARHGARAPVADCGRWLPAAAGATWPCPGEAVEGVAPGSTYRLRSGVKDECGPGELLAEGFAQHRALGRALREAYWAPGAVGKLPTDHITLRSSDLPRTRRSAEALADAFAPSADPRDLYALSLIHI